MVRKSKGKKKEVVLVSIRAFAAQINVSEGAVRKAVKEGKVTHGFDPELKKIDPVAAQSNAWVQQQTVPKPKAGVSKAQVIKKLQSAAAEIKSKPTKEPTSNVATEDVDTKELLASIKITSDMSYAEAMRCNEILDLVLTMKKVEVEEGVLVPKDKVEKAFHALGSELKKALMNIPQKVVRKIQLAKTEVDGQTILTELLSEVLSFYGNLRPDAL